jgi:hypothetical protein
MRGIRAYSEIHIFAVAVPLVESLACETDGATQRTDLILTSTFWSNTKAFLLILVSYRGQSLSFPFQFVVAHHLLDDLHENVPETLQAHVS